MEAIAVKTTKQDDQVIKTTSSDEEDFESLQDVLEIVTLPLPHCTQPNDVLIQVAYSDVNPVDWQRLKHNIKNSNRQKRGANTDDTPPPFFITGHGGTGIVLQVGDTATLHHLLGQAVCFLGDPTRPGSYATHVVADAHSVAIIPGESSLSMREAATIPVAGLTAFESLAKVGLLTSNDILKKAMNVENSDFSSKTEPEGGTSFSLDAKVETIISAISNINNNKKKSSLLIVGGSGGVGSWCITLARAWHPHLDIYATASTGEHEAWCYQLGASKVCRHDPDDIRRTCQQGGMKDAKQGHVDAIICLTEPTPTLFSVLADVIRPYGTICLVVSGDSIRNMDLSFCFFKCVNIATQTVFSSIRTNFQVIQPRDELAIILQLLAAQAIKVPVSPTMLLSSLQQQQQQQQQEESGSSSNNNYSISDKFQHVLLENGILNMLAQKNNAQKYCGNLVLCINGD
jgi:NADPH:quinone reductase-like Zn-dependent oxidoreductase